MGLYYVDKVGVSMTYKKKILSELDKHIERQQIQKTYKREAIITLEEENRNLPIALSSLSRQVEYCAEHAIFYSYNAESIRDHGWGCAWRAIQTCLSSYGIKISFKTLFHLFGPLENLQLIYHDKYPNEELSTSKLFAPYDLLSGWAEPFIGHMVMHFYNISSELESVNNIPDSCNAPQHVFHNKPIEFCTFKERLESHFKIKNAAPIMIDDGKSALNIIGIEKEGVNTTLWIADPHIREAVNRYLSEKTPVGLYKITLNEQGKQISCSLIDEDKHQLPNMFRADIYQGLHFDSKNWMILFPFSDIT